jgi:peptide/nickel transport system substrate-binding protein
VLTYIADPQVAVMALEKGEIDYIIRYWNAQPDMLRQLESNSEITIVTHPQTRLYYYATAWWKEPFNGQDGILLRKAINYALNRTEIAKGAFNGYADPATDAMILSAQRPDSPECCHKGYDYDIDKAKQLLAEAGWKDTDGDGTLDKNGKPLKDLDLVFQDTPDLWGCKDQALVVQSQLKKIGINIKLRGMDNAGVNEAMKKGDYHLLGCYTSGRTTSAANELSTFVLPKPWINFYANENDTLKTIVKNAQMSISEKELNQNLCEACNILYEEAGIIPLVYPVEYAVMSSKVKGFKMGPYSGAYFADHIEECWMEN